MAAPTTTPQEADWTPTIDLVVHAGFGDWQFKHGYTVDEAEAEVAGSDARRITVSVLCTPDEAARAIRRLARPEAAGEQS